MSFIHELQTYVANRDHLGCDESELAEVQSRSPIPLPADYLDFLRVMGRGADGFLVGTDYEFPGILEIQDATRELLQGGPSTVTLPPWFTIAMHQGYQFWTLTEEGVWWYTENREKATLRHSNFCEWFRAMTGGKPAPL